MTSRTEVCSIEYWRRLRFQKKRYDKKLAAEQTSTEAAAGPHINCLGISRRRSNILIGFMLHKWQGSVSRRRSGILIDFIFCRRQNSVLRLGSSDLSIDFMFCRWQASVSRPGPNDVSINFMLRRW